MSAKTVKTDQPNYQELIETVKKKQFHPIYFLHGEEPYFIDAVTNAIVEHALAPSERDFNQNIYYGQDFNISRIITEARSYPVFGERRLMVLKEAQVSDARSKETDIEELATYFEHPMSSTIFVVAYKYKTYDARKKLLKLAKKNGVVFVSEKIKEKDLTNWITQNAQQSGLQFSSKAAALMGESLGTDLGRVISEIEKLKVLFPQGSSITEVQIEQHVGISKDYNFFELKSAFENGDFLKATKIIHYFEKNPKMGPIQPIITNLYNYHATLLKVAFTRGKSDKDLASELRISPFSVPHLKRTIQRYTKEKLARNMSILLEYDLKSKGISNANSSSSDLMKEMMFRLMYP